MQTITRSSVTCAVASYDTHLQTFNDMSLPCMSIPTCTFEWHDCTINISISVPLASSVQCLPPVNSRLYFKNYTRNRAQSKSKPLPTQAAGAIVVAAASTAEKLEACRASGADFLLNYRELEGDATGKGGGGGWRDALKELVGRRGIDVVLDSVGGADCEV